MGERQDSHWANTLRLGLLQKLEHRRRQLIGLRQNRRGRLLQDLMLGQLRRFRRIVDIHDAFARVAGIHHYVVNVVDGVLQPVLLGAQLRSG